VDDQRLGALIRVLRIRRGLRQIDVAILAGVSDATVSRVERGHLESLSLASLRRISRVLEARLDLSIWTRSGEVERVASSRHAELVNVLLEALTAAGWTVRPEVSFNVRGERGLVDIVAWHAETRSLLLIEVKTEIVDVGELFGTFDRKARLAPEIARQLGLDAASFSTALVVADTQVNHRRIRGHAATFGAVLPDGGKRFRSYVARPVGSIAALAYWPNRHPGTTRRPTGGSRRVRRPGSAPVKAIRSSIKRARAGGALRPSLLRPDSAD
jgi:transcriptional regulator with XRE-family HTH domain